MNSLNLTRSLSEVLAAIFSQIGMRVIDVIVFGLVWFDAYHPGKQFFSHVGTEPPRTGYYQYFLGVNMSCSRTQHGDPSGAQPPTYGSRIRGVDHQATAPPMS